MATYCDRLLNRGHIGVGRSAFAYIGFDHTGTIAEDEIHLSFSHIFRDAQSGFEDNMLHDIYVLVARLPALHPWDIQKVWLYSLCAQSNHAAASNLCSSCSDELSSDRNSEASEMSSFSPPRARVHSPQPSRAVTTMGIPLVLPDIVSHWSVSADFLPVSFRRGSAGTPASCPISFLHPHRLLHPIPQK